MEAKITKVLITSEQIAIALRLEFGQGGPIKFCTVSLDDDVLDWQALGALAAYLDRQTRRHMDRERDLALEEPLPGM